MWLTILEEIYNFVWGNLSTEKPKQMKTRQLLAPKTIIQEWKKYHGLVQGSSMRNNNIIMMM